jgi:biotin-(acetyl-CoA carboxylase) ligase
MYTTLKDKIRMGIYSKNFIKDLIFLNSVDSTNSYGLSLEAKEEGIVILTKEQLDGRGRNKRPWHSVKDKSIMMSIIINYPEKSDSTSFIPLLSANAIIETLDSFGLRPL